MVFPVNTDWCINWLAKVKAQVLYKGIALHARYNIYKLLAAP